MLLKQVSVSYRRKNHKKDVIILVYPRMQIEWGGILVDTHLKVVYLEYRKKTICS